MGEEEPDRVKGDTVDIQGWKYMYQKEQEKVTGNKSKSRCMQIYSDRNIHLRERYRVKMKR